MKEKDAKQAFDMAESSHSYEIFMLRDDARKELRIMREVADEEMNRLRREQEEHFEDDLRAARNEIRQGKPVLALVPSWVKKHRVLTSADIDTTARHLVEFRNRNVTESSMSEYRERENEFLTRHREERLQREADDRSPQRKKREETLDIKRDFDRSRR